jgi:hypothetical protein
VELVSKDPLTTEKRSHSEPTIEYETLFHCLQTTSQSLIEGPLIEQVMDQDRLLVVLVDVQIPVHDREYEGHSELPTALLSPPTREMGP